jgi:hypothetical protein
MNLLHLNKLHQESLVLKEFAVLWTANLFRCKSVKSTRLLIFNSTYMRLIERRYFIVKSVHICSNRDKNRKCVCVCVCKSRNIFRSNIRRRHLESQHVTSLAVLCGPFHSRAHTSRDAAPASYNITSLTTHLVILNLYVIGAISDGIFSYILLHFVLRISK